MITRLLCNAYKMLTLQRLYFDKYLPRANSAFSFVFVVYIMHIMCFRLMNILIKKIMNSQGKPWIQETLCLLIAHKTFEKTDLKN